MPAPAPVLERLARGRAPRGPRPRRPRSGTSAIARPGGRVERLEACARRRPRAARRRSRSRCGPAANERAASERASGSVAASVLMPPDATKSGAPRPPVRRARGARCRPARASCGGARTPVMMRSPGRSSSPAVGEPGRDGLDHRREPRAGPCRPAPCAAPRRSRGCGRAGLAGLHARAEGDRPVEDVAGQDLLDRPGRGRAGRRSRAREAARRSSGRRRRARPPPRSRRSRGSSSQSPSTQAVGREEAGERRVDAELLLDLAAR